MEKEGKCSERSERRNEAIDRRWRPRGKEVFKGQEPGLREVGKHDAATMRFSGQLRVRGLEVIDRVVRTGTLYYR